MLYNIIIVLILSLCILLVLIILAQNPKGGGLSSSIGGGEGNQMFGVQQTNKFLVNTTWAIAGSIALLIFISSFVGKSKTTNDIIIDPEIENTFNTESTETDTNEIEITTEEIEE